MKQRKTDLLHRPPFGWRLTLYPLIVIPWAVYLNVIPARVADGVAAIPSVDEVTAKAQSGATPINAAPQADTPSLVELVRSNGSQQVQATGKAISGGQQRAADSRSAGAAPVHGIDGKGRHYLIERNPEWPMTEFRMRLKQPNTI